MTSSAELLVVGKVVDAYGLHGWVKVRSFTQPFTNILGYKDILVSESGAWKSYKIEASRQQGDHLVIKLEGLNDRSGAEALGKVELAVVKSSLPELQSGDYYWHQLIGLKVMVIDDVGSLPECLGKVTSLMETGSNDVLVVSASEDSIDKRERLIPYLLDVVVNVDLENGVMMVKWDKEF